MGVFNTIIKIVKNKHFLSLMNNVVMSGLTLLTFRDMAATLSKSEFGIWLLFMASLTLAETIRTMSVFTPLIKYIAGSPKIKQDQYSGAGWWVFFMVTVALIFIDLLVLLIWGKFMNAEYTLFLHWFPIIFMVTLPTNFAYAQLQAEEKFSSILFLRILNNGLFLLLVIVGINLLKGGVDNIFYAYILSWSICSIICLLMKWAPVSTIIKSTRESFLEIFNMAKYAMVTGVSSNLLRSSDTFIINHLMGPQMVAVYRAPEKILELIELPIRTIAGTAIPEMARELNTGSKDQMARVMFRYVGILTLILIPTIIISYIFAPFIMVIIAGKGYISSAGLLRIFLIYALLLPLDRFLGITLEVLGKANLTLYKVLVMLAVNVLGDVFCIYHFGTINSVAGNSFAMVVVGLIFGHFMLKRYLNFSYSYIWIETSKVISHVSNKIFKKSPSSL